MTLVINDNITKKINGIIKEKSKKEFKDLSVTDLDDIINHKKNKRSKEIIILDSNSKDTDLEYLGDLVFRIIKILKYY